MKTVLNRCHRRAFSLVEVVVAIGIFSFCAVAIASLLVVALESSRHSQRDSAMAAILQNTLSQMTALPAGALTNLPSTNFNFYYDTGGNALTNSSGGFYQATVNRVSSSTVSSLTSVTDGALISPGATNGDNYFLWVLLISYPLPAYTQTNSFIFGRELMGSVTNNFRE